MMGLPLTSALILLVAPLVIVSAMLIHAYWIAGDDTDNYNENDD